MTVLHPLAENLWQVDGPVISVYGLPFSTRMAIVLRRLKGEGMIDQVSVRARAFRQVDLDSSVEIR